MVAIDNAMRYTPPICSICIYVYMCIHVLYIYIYTSSLLTLHDLRVPSPRLASKAVNDVERVFSVIRLQRQRLRLAGHVGHRDALPVARAPIGALASVTGRASPRRGTDTFPGQAVTHTHIRTLGHPVGGNGAGGDICDGGGRRTNALVTDGGQRSTCCDQVICRAKAVETMALLGAVIAEPMPVVTCGSDWLRYVPVGVSAMRLVKFEVSTKASVDRLEGTMV